MKNIFNKLMTILMVVLTCTTILSNRVVKADDDKSNLNNFVTGVKIENESGSVISDGKLYKNQEYKIKLNFAEDGSDRSDKQMNIGQDSATLTYTIPSTFTPTTPSGELTIKVVSGTNEYNVKSNYTISGDKLTLSISKTDQEEAYNKLYSASDVKFELDVDAKLSDSASSGEVDFGGGIKKNIEVDSNKGTLTLSKDASYNANTGTFTYTIKALANGYCKDVVITDTLGENSILTYKKDATAKIGNQHYQGNDANGSFQDATDKGFKYTIDHLDDGQCLAITYTASVNYDSFKNASAENIKFTADQTKNTVSATVDNDNQEPEESTYTKEAFTPISKDGTSSLSDDGKTQTTTWTITVNENALVSMGNTKVTDTLTKGSSDTKFSGEGLTIKKYSKSIDSYNNVTWTQVGEAITSSWADLKVTESSTGFEYTLPSDTEAYKYVITYTTVTTVTNSKQTITNKATDITESSKTIEFEPSEDTKFSVSKSHDQTTLTSSNVDYTVTVNTPASGFSTSFTITDTLPLKTDWINNNLVAYWDTFNEENGITVKVGDTTLNKGTDYTFEYTKGKNENNSASGDVIKITFTDTAISSYFKSTDGAKTVTIQYKTTPSSEDWGSTERKNTAKVNIDGTEKDASDTYAIVEKKIEKELTGSWNTEKIDQYNMPTFQYAIYLSGVTSDSVEVTDAGFVSDIFNVNEISVYAGDYKNSTNTSSGTISYSDSKFSFTPVKKDNGNYYNYYKISYQLKPKDNDAFNKLLEEAKKGSYVITNTATWGELSSVVSTPYTYPALSKSLNTNTGDAHKASYTLTINSQATILNGGNDFTVTDKLSVTESVGSATYDPSSFVIKIDGSETTDITPIFSGDNESFTITVPDNKKIEITYNVKLVGKNGFKYSNEVSALDKFNSKANEGTFNYDSSGSASTLAFTVTKLDSLTKKPVAGATYKLQKKEGDSYTDLTSFTTDSNGSFTVESQNSSSAGWTITVGNTYRLVETNAPSGYTLGESKEFYIVDLNTATKDNIPDNGVISGQTIYVYDASEDTIDLSATKTVNGETPSDEYKFELKQDSNDTVKLSNGNQTVTNDGETIRFAVLKFTQAGTYNFTISEIAGSDENMNYDTSVYKMVVVVEEKTNESDQLEYYSLTKTIYKDGQQVDSITFNNKTKTDVGILKITKTIKGTVNKEEAEGALTFKVTNSDESFNNTYKLNDSGVTYDAASRTYTITIKDVPVGTYTVEETVSTVGGITATVKYKVDSGTQTTGSKAENVSITKDTTTTVAYENDYKTEVEISKVDATSKQELPGATLTITKTGDSSFKEEWTSTNETHKVRLDDGTYTLTETNAPSGYEKAESITFVVENGKVKVNNSEVAKVVMEDKAEGAKYGSITIKKTISGVDTNDLNNIKNTISFTVTNTTDNKKVGDYKLGDDNTVTISNLDISKKYSITEVNGITTNYTLKTTSNTSGNSNVATINSLTESGVEVTFTNTYEKKGSLVLTKTISGDATEDEVNGKLQFTVTGPNNYSKTLTLGKDGFNKAGTNKWQITLSGLDVGEYKVTETIKDVEGKDVVVTYTLNNNTTTADNATVGVTAGSTTNIDFNDDYKTVEHKVKISKLDLATSKELSGATLTITDKDGKVVTSWVSDGKTKEVSLKEGYYTLTETSAPDGYTKAESITFRVDKDGKVTSTTKDAITGEDTVVMKDEQLHKVNISKVEATNSKEIEGAKLKLTDVKGNTVEEWTSTTSVHKVELTSGTYTLTETIAPKGYKVASSITFVVDKTGKVTVNGNEVDTVIMIDELEETTTEKPKTTPKVYKVVKTSSK